jgi:proteic killer suppression protein
MAIVSFKDRRLEAVARGRAPDRSIPPSVIPALRRKLRYLATAGQLDDLTRPPANRLEKLKGDRAGAYSIRVNDQFRLCFAWTDKGPADVEFVDYH